jgi:hypothetical protein
MNELPRIQSLGLPPEKHADRIVAAMLRVIVEERVLCWRRLNDLMAAHLPDGNPAAQARFFKKVTTAADSFLLGSHLEPGKRGRYKMRLLILDGWDAERGAIIGADDPIPEKPWIAVTSVVIESRGSYRYEEDCSVTLFITHHALSRLTQRCGARTLKELYCAVRRIAIIYLTKMAHKSVSGHQRISIELPLNLGTAICALQPHEDGQGGLVLATLWNKEEIECP